LPPCCVQVPPLRVNTHAAPAGPTTGDRSRSALLGPGPPTIAVLPSADSATDMPWLLLPSAPVPTSFGRCSKDRARSAFAAARPFGSTEGPACHPPAETQCCGLLLVTVPETNQHEKHKTGNGKGGHRKQNTANHSCHSATPTDPNRPTTTKVSITLVAIIRAASAARLPATA